MCYILLDQLNNWKKKSSLQVFGYKVLGKKIVFCKFSGTKYWGKKCLCKFSGIKQEAWEENITLLGYGRERRLLELIVSLTSYEGSNRRGTFWHC